MTKKVLITGKNSYIGRSFIDYCEKNQIAFDIDELDLHGDGWKDYDFSAYDSVFHVAGIAHNSSDPKLEDLYYEVNRDLTITVAEKAKEDGVAQFIFMSSIIIYGTQNKMIDENTKPNPDNFYGESKLQAERALELLESQDFKVAILRPPMIYGKGSKGNYPKLAKVAKLAPIFPEYKNKRSMLHVDNLSELLKLVITNEETGLFHPQNKEFVKTSDMVRVISEVHNKRICITKIFNPLIKIFNNINLVNKIFGDLCYKPELSKYTQSYQVNDFKSSIKKTEL